MIFRFVQFVSFYLDFRCSEYSQRCPICRDPVMNLRWLYQYFWQSNQRADDVAANQSNATNALQSPVQHDVAVHEIGDINQITEENIIDDDQRPNGPIEIADVNQITEEDVTGNSEEGAGYVVAIGDSNNTNSIDTQDIGAEVNDSNRLQRVSQSRVSFQRSGNENALDRNENNANSARTVASSNIRPCRIRRRTQRLTYNCIACIICDKPFVSSAELLICDRCRNILN